MYRRSSLVFAAFLASPLMVGAGSALAEDVVAPVTKSLVSAPAVVESVAPVVGSGTPVVDTGVPAAGVNTTMPKIPEPNLDPASRLSQIVVDEWLAHPEAILASNPIAGEAMVEYIKLLVGSDARSVTSLIVLAGGGKATPMQVRSIAKGLAGSAKASEKSAPTYGAYILTKVAELGSKQLVEDFNLALKGDGGGDINTSDLGGGGGGGGGAGGGGAGAGSLTGPGGIGPSGSVGDTSTVTQTGSDTSGLPGRGSVSFSDLGGGVTTLDADPSAAGAGG